MNKDFQLVLKCKKDTFTDSQGKSTTFDMFYVELPQLPGVELKLKPSDSTCRKILASALGLNLEI